MAGSHLQVASDPASLARLVFLSYRFSQGGIGTQNRMLLFLEAHIHPSLFSDAVAPEVRRLTEVMVGPYFLNQTTHPATAIPWDEPFSDSPAKRGYLVVNELDGLFLRFQDRSLLLGFDADVVGIASSVLTMDLDYLERTGGRAGDSIDLMIKVSPYRRDPFGSVFLEHAVLGRPTGSIEFDWMFGQVATPDVLAELDRHDLSALRRIIDIYRRHHEVDDQTLARFAALAPEAPSGG